MTGTDAPISDDAGHHRDHRRYDAHARHHAEHGDSVLIPAATVVVLSDGDAGIEALMLRKNSKIAFGGMWVFPGGKIDAADQVVSDDGATDELATAAAEARCQAEAAEAAAIAAIGLSGTWKGTCGSVSSDNSSYGAQSFVFSGTSFSSDWSLYSDSECSTKNSTEIEAFKLDLGDAYTLADGNTAHKGVLTLVSNLLTLYT